MFGVVTTDVRLRVHMTVRPRLRLSSRSLTLIPGDVQFADLDLSSREFGVDEIRSFVLAHEEVPLEESRQRRLHVLRPPDVAALLERPHVASHRQVVGAGLKVVR